MIGKFRQRVVRHGDHALARIASGLAERVQLFEVHVGDAGLFGEFAPRRCIDRFAGQHESTGQRPGVRKRVVLALDEQHLEIARIESEYDAIDAERETRHGDHELFLLMSGNISL